MIVSSGPKRVVRLYRRGLVMTVAMFVLTIDTKRNDNPQGITARSAGL